jgi:flavin reductase (DIM6/NTAB) family NADH-FMN oxidoreductase RutF
MNADAKKTVLRMIPYGIYVLTADDGKGNISASTVNWVTQSAFGPPLVVVGVKTDSGTYQTVKTAGTFALNMLGKEHKGLAFAFFRPADVSDGKLSGQPYRKGTTGAPILVDAWRRRMPRHHDRRAGRPSHRGRRSGRGASQPAALGPSRRRDPRNEGPRR